MSAEKSTIVRAINASEAGAVEDAVFAGLSARSRYRRFHSPIPRLSDPLRCQLTELDGRRRVTLVAETAAGRPCPVGLVRLAAVDVATPFGNADVRAADVRAADVGVAVVDAWQRRGIGRQLLTAVRELAEELGYTELRGLVLAENEPMLRLLRTTFPQATTRFAAGLVEVSLAIGDAAWTITDADVLSALLQRAT